jgi:hypothetical protein
MDKLDLSEEEKMAIGHKEEAFSGGVREVWNSSPAEAPEPKEFDLNDRDVVRIRAALGGFPIAGHDRRWIERLLDLFMPEEAE